MSVIHLTGESFDKVTGSGRSLVDFWASWCMPCKMVAPVIDELAAEYAGRVTVAKVDIDSEEALAARYDVDTIPTVILFEEGVEKKRFVGVQSKDTYKSVL